MRRIFGPERKEVTVRWGGLWISRTEPVTRSDIPEPAKKRRGLWGEVVFGRYRSVAQACQCACTVHPPGLWRSNEGF
jgi:hypothetical protein